MAYLSVAPSAGQGSWLSPSQVAPGERESAAAMVAQRQQWSLKGLADYADGYLTEAEIKPQYRGWGKGGAQGAFLPVKEIEPRFLSYPARHHQAFGNRSPLPQQGRVPPARFARDPGTYVRPGALRRGELTRATSLADERQSFTLGNRRSPLPQQGKVPPARFARDPGTYLPPQSIDDLTRANVLASEAQRFSLGQLPPYPTLPPGYYPQGPVPAARYSRDPGTYVSPSALMAGLGQGFRHVDPAKLLRTAYVERQIRLDPICDAKGNCIRYPSAAEVQRAIGAKIGGQSALRQGRFQLPAYYQQPALGPWGIDPAAAYRAWASQQAAMQAYQRAPLSIWGSPGMVQQFQPIQGTGYAQPAAYDPSAGAFPQPGAAVERF